MIYLTVLKPGKSKIKALADLVSGEKPLPGSDTVGISCVFTLQKEGELASIFIRALIPVMRLHPHDLITFQRPHLQLLTYRIKLQHMNFGGCKQSVYGIFLIKASSQFERETSEERKFYIYIYIYIYI